MTVETFEEEYFISGKIPDDVQCDEDDIRFALEDVFEGVSSVEIEDGFLFAYVSTTASYIYHPPTWGYYGGEPAEYELQGEPYSSEDLAAALPFVKNLKVEEWI